MQIGYPAARAPRRIGWNQHRLFGPIGYVRPAEAEASDTAAMEPSTWLPGSIKRGAAGHAGVLPSSRADGKPAGQLLQSKPHAIPALGRRTRRKTDICQA